MTLDVSFVYYRNFRFDGKFHVRCIGSDLGKVKSIRYELEKAGPDGSVQVDAQSVHSQAHSGALVHHGCPVMLRTEVATGTYTIRPRVRVMDNVTDLPVDAHRSLLMEPLVIHINEGELSRGILDTVPLEAGNSRRRRLVVDKQGRESAAQTHALVDPYGESQQQFPEVEPGKSYPMLVLKFINDGLERFLSELEPGSGSDLVRLWPKLKEVIDPRPFLSPQERHDDKLETFKDYCYLEQPASMLNDTYLALIKTLAALEYLESLHFVPPEADPGGLPLVGVAAALATLITGAAVVAGDAAYDDAQPTPDYTPRQTYLDEPGPRYQGMNVRKVWAKQVTGKGARVHFSDGGLFPNHEDLRGNPNLKIVTLEPNDDPNHGTESVGVLLAVPNGIGMTGMCHTSELYLYHNYAVDEASRVRTTKDLLRHVEPGDIVAINRQSANVNVLTTYLPSIHERYWWDMTKTLTERGAVVVFAACNGSTVSDAGKGTVLGYGVNLSQWRYFDDHGDADAIVVGACHSWDGKPHQYSNFSYPYRMLNAWGDSVATLGYENDRLQDKSGDDRDYTSSYGGTSSATPLVTGALTLIQSYAMEQHHVYLNADQMHLLVMQAGYRDAVLPYSDVLPMGARPNVHAALILLDQILGGGRFHSPRDEL
ncbi:S8 family serine peptidase [Pseudomonas sp. BBP2017]|uniref:S8 family serine peptidase n=1 Tax=Pseudomonas sp. BBP2017 TaxID=2109731 RepID=UPI000D11F449|nr:S8 family serine peptidase [Pseudomonas sp. BBP2017]PSS51561.1 peptidase S8 [Pseudomonas sp. BBP2017]